MKSFFGLVSAGLMVMGLSTVGTPANAQAPVRVRTVRLNAPVAPRPVTATPALQSQTTSGAPQNTVVSQTSSSTHGTQTAKVVVRHKTAPTTIKKAPAPKAAFQPGKIHPNFAGPPTVVNSMNFGNAQVAGTPVTMTLTYPATPAASIQAAVSTTVPNGGTAPGATSDYIFFGNSNVEFGQPGGGQPVNLTNFTVSTLSNVEYPGNGSYTKVIAPGGTTAFTTGSLTENPTNYPNTTPHTQLLATFSPHATGSFAVYILDGNTDGVVVGNSSVGLGVNGGTAVVSTSHFLSGTNEFTQFNVTNASPSDVFQVYATTSVNNYPTIGGLTFVPEAPNPLSTNLTAAATVNIDFAVTDATCNSIQCTADVTFTPRFPGLAYDSISLTDSSGNLVYQTYVYGTGLAPQFGYELGNETDFTNYVSSPMNVAIGPDERLYYTSSGSNTIFEFARDFSSSSSVTLDGLASPSGIVVDGSNTLYVADQTNNIIISYTAAGVQGTVATTPLSGPSQLAIDGTGALYIADTGNGRVIKIDNQGNETTIASGLVSPVGVAVDSAGDVFYTNEADSNGQIYELRAGDTTAFAFQPQINQTPGNMAVDASGSVFLETDQGLNIFRAGNQIQYGATGGDVAYGVALDRNGDLLFTNPLRNTFTVDDRSSSNFILDAPPGNQTSGTVTISNTGNEPLNFSNFTVTGPQFSIDSSNNLCVLGSLSPNTTCTVGIDFTPPEAQRYTDTLIVTSDSLNAPGTTDPFSLAGNGDGDNSTTTLTASPNPVASGSPVTVYITVTDSSAQYTPMGSITIMDGGSVLGTADLSAGTLAGTSTAQFTIPTLNIGDHDISAAFPGDLAVSPSTSNDVTVTATDGPPPFNGGISVDSQNFGTVAIGQSVTMSISGTPTGGSLSLANRKDFDVSIDGCSNICHYQITFNPLTPGLRTDLVSVYDDEGELEGQVYVYGIGSGPQLGFDPHPDLITQGGGIVAPTGIAIGQDGEQYTTDPGTNQVFATGGGSTVTLQILNLGKPAGIAVDAGNIVYVADQKNNLIVTYNVNSRVQGSVTTSQLNQPTGVAVDGAGDLFITDKGNNRILKIDNQGTETVLATDSVQSPRGIALDSAGDVFYTDDGNGGEIIKLPAAGGSPVSIASSLGAVRGIAVDAAGVIYYASGTGLNLFGPAGNTLALNFASAVDGVTLDSDGDIYLTVPASSEYVESVRYQAAYSYAANVGTSTPGTRAISNIGNTPLTISDLSITGPPFTFDSSSQCAVGTVLSPALSCNTVVDFTPFTTGESTGTATVTSDSLNEPGSTNAIQYFGTANGNSGTNVTVTGLTVSSNSVTKGHPVIFTVTVADTLTPATPPTGTVDFFNDGSYIGTATLPFTASGSAATLHFTTSSLPVGTSPITAQYFGDSNFQGSTSMVQNVTVTQPPPPVGSMQNFGSVAVGQTVTGTVTFAGGGTPSFQTSNTEDFKITGYSCNSSCVVSVSFTPIFPGSRTDAIYEYDTYGNAVAEAYVYGTGTGPLFGFNPGNSAIDGTWESPNGIAISQAGVAYLSDTATNQVFVLASGVPPLPIQNLGTPGSVAVDGGGTVYVVDQTNNVIVTYNQGTQLQGSVMPTNALRNPAQIAIDGAGSLYIADQGNNRIVKIDNQGVQSSVAIGLSSPSGVAVDAAGNVYYADNNDAGEIVEVPVNGDPIIRLGTSLGSVLNLSLDAAGSVYYTGNFSGIRIITPSRQSLGFTGNLTGNLNGIALGPNGDIYTTQQSTGYEEQLSRAGINFFSSTQVGVPVQHGGPQVFNTGNTPLTISSLALASGTVFTVDSSSICQNGLVLSAGGLCNTLVNFLPTEVGAYSDTLTFTSNSNNVAGSTNLDSEAGNGTPHFFIGSRTALAVSSNSITAGQSVTLTATVTIESDVPQSTPTGTVNFFDGMTQIGSGTLTATGTVGTATASFVASSLAIGSHSITAVYGGDSSYSSSTSDVQTVVVATVGTTPSQTQVLVFPSANLVQGQSFNVQGYVTAQSGSAAPNPTGTVTFFDGTNVIGSGPVSPNGPVGTSSASINASPLPVGTHSITAMYSGDSTYAPNTSPATTVTVSAPPPTTYNSVNFGSVPIGQSVQMTINFSQGVNYFIRGVNDPEFTNAGSLCNTTCTETYNFTPQYPGLREYALSVYDQGFNLVARTYLYGTGTGPQFGFDFSTNFNFSDIQQPTAIALGPDGTRYITDMATKQVYTTVSGSAAALPITGLVNPTGIAVDGVSKIYVADRDNNVIVTYDPVASIGSNGFQGAQGTLATSQLFHPTGVAVDATGAVYITDTNNSRVIKVDNSGNETTLASGVANLGPIAVDGAGDVFYASTTTGGSITELPAGGGLPVMLASNVNSVHGLGVDASGRVYYTDDVGIAILPLPSCTGCTTERFGVAGFNVNQAYGVALAANGDVWTTAPAVSLYANVTRTAQSGAFEAQVGSTSQTPFLVSNTGNAPLTISAISSSNLVFTVDPSSTCAASTVLAAGMTCKTVVDFTPTAAQFYDESLTFTSNSLNAAGSTNVFETDGPGDAPTTTSSTTTLSAAPTTSPIGGFIDFTATVQNSTGTFPTGTVNLLDGMTVVGTGNLSATSTPGKSTVGFSVSSLGVGVHSITAMYVGDTNVGASTSAPQSITITKGTSTTTLGVNNSTPVTGQRVTFTATVNEGTNIPPSGTVNFLDGATVIGSSFVDYRTSGGSSTAEFSTSSLAVGTHSITAAYVGDANFDASTSAAQMVIVAPPAPAVISSLNLGSVAVGQTASMNITYTEGTNPTISAVNNLDFVVSTVNCSTACVATISFTPQYPGLRDDAVTVTDANGTLLAKTFIYGTGTAGQFGFLPGSSTINTSFTFPTSITFDAAGVGYLTDAATDKVYPLVTDAQALPIAGLGKPGGIALDGSGTFYIADKDNNRIVTYNRNTNVQGVLTTSQVNNPGGVAVDGTGAVYIADTGNNRIIKVDNQGVETTVASANTPQAVAVDSANNLYYSDLANNGEIIELPAAGGSPITLAAIIGGTPTGIAVDASGSIYYVGNTFSGIRDVLPGGVNNGQIAFSDALTGGHSGLGLNANGDIWTMQSSNGILESLHRSTAVFTPSTPVGTPKQHIVQVVNTGNGPLTLSNVTFSDDTAFSFGSGSPCAPGTVLSPASECDTYVVFNPPAAQTYTSFLNYTSDTLNVAGSVTTDGEVGTGTGSALQTSTTTLSAASTSFTAGQSAVITATVVSSGSTTPTGTVTLYQGSTQLATGNLAPSGTAGTATTVFTVPSLSAGTYNFTAVYAGDANVQTSTTAAPLTVTVNPASAASTTTTLTISAGFTPYETPVTLSAAVATTASSPVTVGQVIFCDSTAPRCNLLSNLAIAQLTSAGIATVKLAPGVIDHHSYIAVFVGTTSAASSVSTVQGVFVTGKYPPITSITSSGTPGNYTLTGTVIGVSNPFEGPTGSVSFVDTTNSNVSLGSATLGTATAAFTETQPTGSPYATDAFPYGVATGDFNGDGKQDVVFENYNAGTVSVLLGNGDGTFQPAVTYAVGNRPERVMVADFNGDGKLDLVVANTGDNTISILLGNGDGTFQAQVTYPVSSPVGLGIMDLNHDGIPDIAAASYYGNEMGILIGNGDGTFKPVVYYATGATPQSLAEGDFNGDGNIDIVTGNVGAANLSIFLGNGDGTFQTRPLIPTFSQPQGIAVGDFNGDGIADLAVTSTSTNSVGVLLGQGDGTFPNYTNYAAGNGPVGVVVADFDGDGHQDISVDNTGSNTESVLRGNGDGSFQLQTTYATGTFPYGVAVADFNGDGYPDLAVSDSSDNTGTILLSQVTQTATASISNVSVSGASTHNVDASYAGDSNYGASVSTTIPLTTQSSTSSTTTLTPFSNNVTVGGDLLFSASVVNSVTTTNPTGAVTLYMGATAVGSQNVMPAFGTPGTSTAGFVVSNLPAGTYTFTASYAGDTNVQASTSSPVTVTVSQVTTSTSLSVSAPTITAGQAETLTATVSGQTLPTMTGSVTFFDGSTQLGTGSITATSSGGTATFATSSLGVGTHNITATYNGDTNYSTSTSTAQTVNVNAAPVVITSQNFGSVAVGQSATMSVVFNLASGPNFTALSGTDFSVTSSSCDTTCTATVKFTPKFPGVREDVIAVTDNSGSLLAKAYVNGIGTGPQLGFDPGMNETFSGTIQAPTGVAIGPQSIEYFTDTVAKKVWAVSGSGVNAVPITGLGNPVAVAVDGGGIVYVVDQTSNAIVTYNTQTNTQGTLATTPLLNPVGIAVDGAGNVYISDQGNNQILKVDNQGNQTAIAIELNSPHGIAVDSAGDVFFTDQGNGGEITERTIGGSVFGVAAVTGTVSGLALDAAGKIYYTTDNGLHIIAPGGTFSTYGTSLSGSIAGVAVGPEGNLYVTQPSTGTYIISERLAGQGFPTGPAGSTTDVPFVISNTGNAPLTLSNFTFTAGTPYAIDSLSGCAAGTSIAAGLSCNGTIDFTPSAAQSYPSVMTVTSNSLNIAGFTNVDTLFGQGTPSAATSTTTSLTLSSANIIAGQTETLTALVAGNEPPTITGTVTFYDVTTSLGSAPVVDPVEGDTATLMLSTLSVGTHQITATYNGDANHLGSSSAAMTVTVTAPPVVISSLNLGSVAVGQTASMNITYTEGTNPTISAVNNLDFVVSTVNCSTTCVATVSFTPQYPGLRDDAVTVKDANGNLLAETFIYGTGTAPQFAFDIGLQTTPITYGSSGTPGPIAVGPDGTYYVADTTNNQVKAFANNGFATLNVGTIGTPAGLAVDGAGKVYVSDPAHNRVVYELNGVPGVVPVTFSQPSFLATDGTGALYVLDNGFDHIVKIDNQGNQTIIGTTPQASAVGGIAVDAAGNVFFVKSNGDNSAVTEFGGSTTPALNVPVYAIAVDAADRRYLSAVDDPTNRSAIALLSPGATSTVNYPISSSNALPPDIEVDQAGRILVSEPSIGQVDIYNRSSGNISSLTAPVGSSAQATVTVSNTGNTPLFLSQLAIASNGFTLGAGGTCAVGGSVAPAGTCTVVVTFAPAAAQTYQGTLTIGSNSLNSTQASNQFTLSGQGQSTGQAATSATLMLSAANITVGQTETLTANITGGPTPALTGTVTFRDGVTSLGSNPVTATSTGATASLSVSNLAVGSHQITASYSGDTNYLGTTTEASTVTVTAASGPAINALNFGNIAVGQSTSMNVVYAVGATPIIRAAENQEFKVTAINCETSCVATITFTPQYPGLRSDLVTVKNGNGDVLAKTYVYGIGTGPQFGFDPGTSSVFTNIQQPTGIAVDIFGARYISDQATNQVFLVSDGTSALPITGLGKPAGVAVDGGEKVYVADQTNNVIVTYDQNAGRQGTVATTPLSSPTNIAVDGTGALYIVDAGNNRIIKIDNQGNESTLVSDTTSLGAIALDSAGDVYYSITGSPGSITELPVGGGQPIGIANNIGDIHGLAVDASNRVYYTNDAGLSIIPLPSCGGCFLEGLRNTGTGDSSYGIALGPDGNIFLTSPSTSTYAVQNRATGAGSVTANVGSSAQQDPFIVSNTGNAPLTISSIAIDATVFGVDPASGCVTGTVLTAGSICNTVVDFTPLAATTYQDPLVFTSNSLNVAGSQNVFSETGTGTAPLTPSTTTLAVSPSNSVALGQTVTLTATVTETTNIPPSGTVNFLDGAAVIGSSSLKEVANGGTSTVSFTTSSLAAGSHSITAMYVGDSNFQPSTSAPQTVTVAPPAPTLASISPTGGVVGSAAKTVTLTGTNFSTSDVVQLNGATISSTFVNATTLTAVLPASFFAAAGTGQITVFDPVGGTTTAAQPFSVVASPAIQFSGPTTGAPAQQPTLTFALSNPYPFPIAGTLTLAFAPAGALPVDDPSIQFSSGGRTIAFAIPALSTATPVVQLQTGTVAGKVTVTLDVTSNGVDVTPANVTPVVINIPAIVPAITTAAVTRSGNTLSVVIQGYSNTRELSTAMFHFTAADGSAISTPDITAQVGTVFATWFASAASAQYGSAFTYTQEFNLNNDASTVGTVTVTLVNSIGTSSQGTAQ